MKERGRIGGTARALSFFWLGYMKSRSGLKKLEFGKGCAVEGIEHGNFQEALLQSNHVTDESHPTNRSGPMFTLRRNVLVAGVGLVGACAAAARRRAMAGTLPLGTYLGHALAH